MTTTLELSGKSKDHYSAQNQRDKTNLLTIMNSCGLGYTYSNELIDNNGINTIQKVTLLYKALKNITNTQSNPYEEYEKLLNLYLQDPRKADNYVTTAFKEQKKSKPKEEKPSSNLQITTKPLGLERKLGGIKPHILTPKVPVQIAQNQ